LLAIECIAVISMIDVQKMVNFKLVESIKHASAAEAMLEQQQNSSV
jgi:hypothetical protein